MGTWSERKITEKQRKLWAGNHTWSSAVTSISLCGPSVTNQTFLVKYRMQDSVVQEVLSSQIEDTLQRTRVVFSQKVTAWQEIMGWNIKACLFTWADKTHTAQCLASPLLTRGTFIWRQCARPWEDNVDLTGGGSYFRFCLFSLIPEMSMSKKKMQFSFCPQTHIRYVLPFVCENDTVNTSSNQRVSHCFLLSLFF